MRNCSPKTSKHKTPRKNLLFLPKQLVYTPKSDNNNSKASEYFQTPNDSLNILENVKTPVRNFIRSEALKQFRKCSLDSLKNAYLAVPNEPKSNVASPNPSLYFTCDGDVLGEHCSINSQKLTPAPIENRDSNIVTSTPISSARNFRKLQGADRTIFAVAKCKKIDLKNISLNGKFAIIILR